MKLFLDANILFSAAYSDGAINQLLYRMLGSVHVCCINTHVVEEARRNLLVHRQDSVGRLDDIVRECVMVRTVESIHRLPDADLPLNDALVVAAAVESQCTHLVTGDKKHFGPYYGRTVADVMILSPVMMFKLL